MEILRFYKENSKKWYVDIPYWKGRKSALQMIGGADKLLDLISKGRNEIYLHYSKNKINYGNVLILKRKCWFNGADYKINNLDRQKIDLKVWLCNVTKFVMYDFPMKIYFREVVYDEHKY